MFQFLAVMSSRNHVRHSRRRMTPMLVLLSAFVPQLALSQTRTTEPTRPNIVVILADDLGYGDLACYGHPAIRSPNLDKFARDGLRLTDCYSAAPNCSPARAGLMTGRTPTRVGIYNWIPTYCPMHLRRSEITIATLLRDSGYATCHVGKWHLSGALDDGSQPQPGDHGFDHWFATQNNALPNHRNPTNFYRNGKSAGPLQGYSAPLVAGEASHWLTKTWNRKQPFFMFVCFHEPHEPIATDPKHTQLYKDDPPSLGPHHGNVTQLDEGFGSLVKTLDSLEVRDNTLVWFTSDNGPAVTGIHPHGSAGPLREKKGYVYDGGIRVPGIIQWPNVIAPGTTSHAVIGGVDLLPTLCAVAGIAPPADRTIDGVNVLPAIRGDKNWTRSKPLFWQFHRARGDVRVAMRDNQWKIVAELSSPRLKPSGSIEEGEISALKRAELKDFRLFNLRTDVSESTDVSQQHPKVFANLKDEMTRTHADIRKEQPLWDAWDWPRYESKHIVWPAYRKRPAQKK